MAIPLYKTSSGQLWHAGCVLICLVGLPARGKTHISRSLERYCRWLGVNAAVFSLGDYRRKVIGSAADLPSDYFLHNSRSEDTEALRIKILEGLDEQVFDFFRKGGQVAVYDANNTTMAARQRVIEVFEKKRGAHVIFGESVESICTSKDIVEDNIRSVKISSPDYKSWSPEAAVQDYWKRIQHNEISYQTLDPKENNGEKIAFVKIFNVRLAGEKLILNHIKGYLQSRLVFLLSTKKVRHERKIYFARSGSSLLEQSYKSDSDLSASGWEYAEKLKEWIDQRKAEVDAARRAKGYRGERKLNIWTSARRRCYHTAWPFVKAEFKVQERSELNELNPGILDGVSVEQMKEKFPDLYEGMKKAPFAFRAPRGESYHDLCLRVEPIIFALEREQEDLLIIGHATVLRCLMAYLAGISPKDIPSLDVERGMVYEITPASYGTTTKAHPFWDKKKSMFDQTFSVVDGMLEPSPRTSPCGSVRSDSPHAAFMQAGGLSPAFIPGKLS